MTEERIRELRDALRRCKAGKASLDRRVKESEQWWKLRNDAGERPRDGFPDSFRCKSGWLHNVITSKHADAMDAYPEVCVLAREAGDREEARLLQGILPVILESCGFEEIYAQACWQKLKTGTGVYKVCWDGRSCHGLGDVSISRVNILNLFWEPGIDDVQSSRYVFQTELADRDSLEARYPEAKRIRSGDFRADRFRYDDAVDDSGKVTVVDCYYHDRKGLLQFVKFAGDVVLEATEDDPRFAEEGLYRHGKYPYVFDRLFPIEGSPCGYGFVDLCKGAQTEIDLLKTTFLRNALAGATPRFFLRADGQVNEEEFCDLNRQLVHVNGSISEDAVRQIGFAPLSGVYLSCLENTVEELRQVSGNTETSTGNVSAGVTAASAIAALQEASGKGSRDASLTSYRAFGEICRLIIELIRQFYGMPRAFRITGESGREEFVQYSSGGLGPRSGGEAFGVRLGYRVPEFDVRVTAQKQTRYTSLSRNELALELYRLGFFDPARAGEALGCLDLMEFERKEELREFLEKNAARGRT